MTLQPAGEDTTNQYVAPILPSVPGEYTLELRGTVDSTEINQDVNPEEVVSADSIEFPSGAASGPQQSGGPGWSGWLSIIGATAGVAGLIVALAALRRTRT